VKQYLLLNASIGRYDAAAFRSSADFCRILFAGSPREIATLIARGRDARWSCLGAAGDLWRRMLDIPTPLVTEGTAFRVVEQANQIRRELSGWTSLAAWLENGGEFSGDGFQRYARSLGAFLRVAYVIRPGMHFSAASIGTARKILARALRYADQALGRETRNQRCARHLARWKEFLVSEQDRLDKPAVRVSLSARAGIVLPLRDDRPMGPRISLVECLLGYFTGLSGRPGEANYWPSATMTWSAEKAIVEVRGYPMPGNVGDPLAIFFDPGAAGRRFFRLLLSTGSGRGVFRRFDLVPPHGLKADARWAGEYALRVDRDAIRLTIPLAQFGACPSAGARWGFNVFFNRYETGAVSEDWTHIADRPAAWSAMFSGPCPSGDPARFGRITFQK